MVELKKADGTGADLAVTGRVTVDAANKIIAVDPDGGLAAGSYTVKVLANTVEDVHGNAVAAASATFTVDAAAPTVTFAPKNGATAGPGVTVKATFTEAIRNVGDGSAVTNANAHLAVELKKDGAGDDLAVVGRVTVNGNKTVLAIVPASPLAAGSYTVRVLGNAVEDAYGNAVATASATFTVDATAPTVAMTGVPAYINGTAPFTATLTFDEAVTGFVAGDVRASNAGLSGWAETTPGRAFEVDVTPDGGGDVTVTVAMNSARDADGNAGPAAAVSRTAIWDATPPEVSIAFDPPSFGPANLDVAVTFAFTEIVTGFDPDDITVAGGDKPAALTSSQDGQVYRGVFTPTGSSGDLEVSVARHAATDRAGNPGPADTVAAAATRLAPAPVSAPVIETFTAHPAAAAPGEAVTLRWTLSGGEAVQQTVTGGELGDDIGEEVDPGVTVLTVRPTEDTVYTLTVGSSPELVDRATVAVAVTSEPVEPVEPVNAAPTGVGVDWVVPAADGVIAEDVDAGAGRVRVAELSALDEDAGDRHVFRVSDTAILEVIDAALYLKQGAALDYETAPSHRFTVTATDSGGLRFTGPEQTLTVADANEAPTGVGVDWVVPAAGGVIAEDVDAGAGRVRVAELSALDEDAGDRHVFRVSDTAILEVIDAALYLKQGAALDYETAPSHRFTVTATDSGGLRFTGPEQTLTVADANAAPTGVGVDWVVPAADGVIAEDVDAGAGRVRVAELSALDEDAGDRHVFRVSDTAILEVIDAALYLKQGAALDYETAASHRFTVTATDSGGLRFTGPEQTLTVADANEAPTGVGVDWVAPAAGGVIAEDVDAGAGRVRVAELSALDEDAGDRHVFRVSDTAILEVIDAALYLKQGAALDYETAASHRFTVTATDSGGLRFNRPRTDADGGRRQRGAHRRGGGLGGSGGGRGDCRGRGRGRRACSGCGVVGP